MQSKKLKAVFFDMDGVLYDSMKNHALSWQQAMAKFGLDYRPYFSYLNEGRTSGATINWAFNHFLNRDATTEEINDISQEKTKIMSGLPASEIFKESRQLIQALKQEGIKVMIVTGSNQKVLIDRIMNEFNLKRGDIISGGDVSKGKPNPEPYIKALEKSATQPHEAIIIENAPLGIEAAKAAGIFTIAVNTGILENAVLLDAGADILLPDMESLLNNWTAIQAEFEKNSN